MEIVSEKRNNGRLRLEFDLKYKDLRTDGPPVYRIFHDSKTSDISKRGVRIRTRSMMEKNSVINAKMRINGKTIRTFCEVKWSGADRKTGVFESGLSFIMYNETDMSWLGDYIDRQAAAGQSCV